MKINYFEHEFLIPLFMQYVLNAYSMPDSTVVSGNIAVKDRNDAYGAGILMGRGKHQIK